jgi:protein ImuB
MTVNEARSRCAAVRILPWDEVAIADEVRRVTAALLFASPQVTPVAGAPGTWWVGAGGFEALGGEAGLAHTLLDIARLWHPGARVAIADSCVAARAATWDIRREVRGKVEPPRATVVMHHGQTADHPTAATIVPYRGCAVYLARVPLGLIPMDDDIRETLIALGIRTAGPLAALTAEDVERRWGAPGLVAWRLASGDDARRPVLARLEAARAVSAELSPSVTVTEPILFLVRAALDRLVRELIADGRAAAVVAITLTLDDARGAIPGAGRAHTITREVRLSRPLARVAPLLERCRALLEQWELTAPVCVVGVAVPASAPLTGEQGELLDPAWRDPAAADAAFARLRAELGPDAIVRPVVRDEHRPEHAGGWVDMGADGEIRPVAGGGGRMVASGLEDRGRGAPPKNQDTPASNSLRHHSIADRSVSLLAPRVSDGPPSVRGEPIMGVVCGTASSIAVVRRSDISVLSPLVLAYRGRGSVVTDPDSRVPIVPVPLRLVDAALTLIAHPMFELAAAFRHLESPEPVDVECAGETPRALWWRGRHLHVRRAIGPERLAGDWWKDPYARDYWRCEQGEPLAYLLVFRERRPPAGQWYVQGWYD